MSHTREVKQQNMILDAHTVSTDKGRLLRHSHRVEIHMTAENW